jgi:hypothetical protein
MNARCRAILLLLALLFSAAVTACDGHDDNGGDDVVTPTDAVTPTDVATSTLALTPPSDCQGSTEQLPNATGVKDVTVELATDLTKTTLLLTNRGPMSIAVIPPADGSARLDEAPYADPDDPVAVAGINAVMFSANASLVPGMPEGVPPDQVYFVPPDWAVCVTTGNLLKPAAARYLRDKVTSAVYFAATALDDALEERLRGESFAKSQTLITCARDTVNLLTNTPDLADTDLYADVITGQTACRSAYNSLLHSDAEAQETGSRALRLLDRVPQLLEDSKFALAIVR